MLDLGGHCERVRKEVGTKRLSRVVSRLRWLSPTKGLPINSGDTIGVARNRRLAGFQGAVRGEIEAKRRRWLEFEFDGAQKCQSDRNND